MKKLVFISGLLFAMTLGFTGCDNDVPDSINGTKWEKGVSVVGVFSGDRISFDANDTFKKIIVAIGIETIGSEGTYEYANGSGKLIYENGNTDNFTVKGKKLTLNGVTYKKK